MIATEFTKNSFTYFVHLVVVCCLSDSQAHSIDCYTGFFKVEADTIINFNKKKWKPTTKNYIITKFSNILTFYDYKYAEIESNFLFVWLIVLCVPLLRFNFLLKNWF